MNAPEKIKKLVDEAPEFVPLDDDEGGAGDQLEAHPLAQFTDLDGEVQAPCWVVPGFIAHGIVAIAGAHGVGKTTALLPLSMAAAGLCVGHEDLRPEHWRHVVYITEDMAQAQRIVQGLVRHGGYGVDMATVKARMHFVEAKRLPIEKVVKVGKVYRDMFTRNVAGGVELPPLVVIDTKSAVLDVEDENDNAQASRIIALLKQGFGGLPVWLVGHLAKAQMNRTAARELSMRGGGAVEADANQTLYLVSEDDGTRYLVRGKTRFEARWPELRINSSTAAMQARGQFGGVEEVTLRWGIAVPPEMTRHEAAQQAREQARKDAAGELRGAVLDAVAAAWRAGAPLNREMVKAKVPKKRSEVSACIEVLIADGWLHEVPVPAKERRTPSKASFLVALDAAERDAMTRDGQPIPAAKQEIPASWRRPIPPVPDSKGPKSAGGPN